MARTKIVVDLSQENPQPQVVPYTADEEATADAANTAWQQAQAPIVAEAARIAAIKTNARRAALMNALTTLDDAGLIAAIGNRYPTLSGDAIKAVTDIYLVITAVIRS